MAKININLVEPLPECILSSVATMEQTHINVSLIRSSGVLKVFNRNKKDFSYDM